MHTRRLIPPAKEEKSSLSSSDELSRFRKYVFISSEQKRCTLASASHVRGRVVDVFDLSFFFLVMLVRGRLAERWGTEEGFGFSFVALEY